MVDGSLLRMLSSLDLLVLASIKNAAKCDELCVDVNILGKSRLIV